MTGAEIAWRTLRFERVEEPCIIACWMMKRDFLRRYAEHLRSLTDLSLDRTLCIGHFALPSFMAGYTRWCYQSYLAALLLYPVHFRRFSGIEGEKARAHNLAIRE